MCNFLRKVREIENFTVVRTLKQEVRYVHIETNRNYHANKEAV